MVDTNGLVINLGWTIDAFEGDIGDDDPEDHVVHFLRADESLDPDLLGEPVYGVYKFTPGDVYGTLIA